LHGVQFKDGELVRTEPAASSTDQDQDRVAA
jgi:hypothetical protein